MKVRSFVSGDDEARMSKTSFAVPFSVLISSMPFPSGHLSLVRKAAINNDVLVASVFVNPTQFGPNEDFNRYPRQLERDTELLQSLGVHHIFAPKADSMYGRDHLAYVDVKGFDKIAEGRARPGHFQGVATVVTKLFNIVSPTNAYFGQKDAAQCVLIRRIVEDLDMDVNVIVLDTIREDDGLALSSRNAYLTTEERRAAPVLYRSLCAAKELFQSVDGDVIPAADLREVVEAELKSEPLMGEIQYVSIDNQATMQPIQKVLRQNGAIVSIACKVGSVRLIDNIVLE